MNSSRDEILNKLRKAKGPVRISQNQDKRNPIYFPVEGDLALVFKTNNELINGITSVFDTENEMFDALTRMISSRQFSSIHCADPKLREKLESNGIRTIENLPEIVDAGITGCEFLVAHTGSAVVSSFQQGGRTSFIYPPIHIIIASENQIVDYLETAFQKILDKYKGRFPSLLTTITGPSRTADIEKTMVYGAHGPKELHIFISKK